MSDSRKATPLRSCAAEGSCYAARAAAAERIGSGSILPARPPQEHTGADADHPRTPDAGTHGSLFRPSRAAQLSYSHRCRAGHRVQAQPAGLLRAGLACRATGCGLSLPGPFCAAQPAYRPLWTAVSFAYRSANAASFSIRRIAAGVSRDPSDARRPSARASRRGSSIA